MLRYFDAYRFLEIYRQFSLWEAICDDHIQHGNRDSEITEKLRDEILLVLMAKSSVACEGIELKESLNRIRGPFTEELLYYGIPTWDKFKTQLKVVRELIESELSQRHFVFIPVRKMAIIYELESTDALDSLGNPSWMSIWQSIPSSEPDSREAVYCYAVGRYTASVFHSMRVAEQGLRSLAKRLRVALKQQKGKTHPVEYADWGAIITALKNKLHTAQALPKGQKRSSKLSFYSDLADHCTYIKDHWRSDVSHTRTTYLEIESLGVLQRVKGFMGSLNRL